MSRARRIGGLAALMLAALPVGRILAGDVVILDDDDGYVTVDGAVAFVDPDVAVVDGDGVSYFVENDELVDLDEVVGEQVRVRYFAPTTTTRVVRRFAPATTSRVVRSFAPMTTSRVVRSFAPMTTSRVVRSFARVTSHKVVKVRSFAPAVDVIDGDTTLVVDRPVMIRKRTTIIEQ